MARANPQVEALVRTVDILRKQIERMRQDPPDIPFAGCGDSSCITTQGLGGMHTNGGCRCDQRALRRAVSYWRDVAVRRQVAIQDMLRGIPRPRITPEQLQDWCNLTLTFALDHDEAEKILTFVNAPCSDTPKAKP